MKSWPVQDAKARFIELLNACVTEGPQMVTRRGTDMAVLVPVDEWSRLHLQARPTLKELLLAPSPRQEFSSPPRGGRRRRNPHGIE